MIFHRLEVQHGDNPTPVSHSWVTDLSMRQQIPCYITHTNEIRMTLFIANLDRGRCAGVIEGIGPRYCPSIEDDAFC